MVASSVTSRGSSRAGEDAAAEARCRAARDKLRIVREAMEANATHLQALDAYEVEKAAYLARRAPLDAAEEARRARSEAAAALAEETGEGGTPRGDAIHGAHHGVDLSREHAREEARRQDEEAFAAYEEAVAALGPVPAPPPFRDHLNDARVAADGTDGPPLFLLTCGVLEGAGERGVALLKELMARGARAKGCVGSRPNHGERLAPLCLALAHLERFADPGDPEPEPGTGTGGFFGTDALLRGLGIVPGDARSASGSSAGASWETSSEGSESSAGSANEGTARKTPDPGTPRSVARFGSEGSESGAEETEAREEKTRELSPPAIETERVVRLEADDATRDATRDGATTTSETETGGYQISADLVAPSRPARLRDVKNAITALIAGGADVNARCRLGAFRNGPHEMLARPFRAVCAYRGVAGTVGDALFLAAVAATSPATPLETRLECVDVAARLIASGADLEARGTRPGSGHGCGEDLAPLAMALAAMEQDACAASGAYGDDPPERFFEYALDDVDGNPNATLAAALLAAERVSAADSESYAESETSGKSSSRSDAGADADPTRVRLSAGRLDALVSALKHTHGRDVTREQARALVGETRDSHAYAVSESSLRSADDVSSETGDTRSREKEPAVDVGAVTTFAHVPTRREFRARRLAVGETGAAAPASGPPLWHAACAAAEGAGAPAVAAARKLLKLGADPDAVGSRPGHCLPGTPALAMCVAALRGRARHPSPRHDRDWWPASETDGEAAKVQVPSRRVDASSASSAVSSFLGSRAETLNPRRVSGVPEVSPAARHARAAFEAEVVRGLERFLETNADRSPTNADLVAGADARIGYWSRAIGAPFRWSARAEADAVASANAIAVAHRETRLAAVSYMRASVADLRAYVPIGDVPGDGDGGSVPTDRSNREARARADALALAEALVAARADCDAPMKVVSKHAAALETDDAFPLGIAVGLFSESSGGDELARRAALALMDEGGADVSKRGVCAFPLVSSPLFAATRAIRRNVPQSVDLFRRLLEKGADVDGLGRFPEGTERTPLIELLHTLREGKVFRPGVLSLVRQLVEREKCDVRAPRPEVYLPTPHAAYAFREDEDPGAEPGASSRGELSHSETSASLLSAGSREEAASKYFASETGEDAERALRVRLSAARVDELVRTLSTRYGFDVTREQVRALVGETRDSHAYAVSESSLRSTGADGLVEDIDASASAASSGPGPGALFPAWPPRVGRCEYAPLFWALEAVCGDGFDEARQAVELIAHALGGDVDAPQGTNHHSHVSGSIPAMATAAAIRAAAPLADPPSLAESVSSAAERRGAITRAESSEASESSVTTCESNASETESRVFVTDALPNAAIPATIPGTDLVDAYAALAAAADDANAAADLSDARNVRDIRDIRDVHGGSKLPPPADRSRFRSRARGVLGASRFEKATRAAAREKAREAAAARLAAEDAAALERREVARARAWRGAGVRTREGYEDARVVPAGASEDAPPGRLDAEAEALHADLDEIKKRSARSVAGDDVKSLSKAPPPGLMGALAALLGLDETEATSIGPEHSRDAEASARLARLERAASARAARLDASAKTAFFLLRLTKRIDATCVNPLLKEVGAASLAPFEHTPLFCALHGAATAAGAEQMALANQLATLCLDRGADVSAPGAHAGVGGDGFSEKKTDDVNASPLRSYPLMWAVAAALRADTPNARVDDALALVRRLVAAGADPAAANFAARLSRRPAETSLDESRGKEGEERSYASKVLHLWDERALLLEVFDQREWQRVMTLRLDLQRVLGEAGARATFRAESGMRVVARRAAPSAGAVVPVPGAPRNESRNESYESYESSSLERLKWAEGVRRTRELLEHGGVPSQYAVWVWPTTEREAFPPGDRLGDARRTRRTKNARNASFERSFERCAESNSASEFEYAEAHRAPRPFGAPARECEIEVMPRRADLRRPGARGAVDVTRVRAEDVFEEELSDGSDGLNENPYPFRALTSRLLWEARVDGVPERADAARRASVLAVRELLAGEPAEPPASSDSSDAEPVPAPSASESDASEYESRFAFVPEAPRRRSRSAAGEKKSSRGVVHAALVFMGFRKKKRRKDNEEKKPAEDAEGDDDDARRAVSNSALKPPHLSAPKEPFRKTLAEARDEALGSVAEALMRNPNSAQADRFHGVPSLAAMARAETSRRDDTTRRAKLSSTSREKTELADDFADPPPPAFGALGRYMQAVEREEAPDWNAATRRPMRRLLT